MYRSGVALLGASLTSLEAQESQNGKLIVGQPKGAFSTEMAERLLPVFSKQAPFEYRLQIISEQNTRLASRTAKQATPDGTTILQAVSASMSLLPNVYDSIEYDPINDFTPLALLGDYTYVLAVGPAVPQSIQTVDAYVDWVSKNPHFRDVGITLYGSQSHVAGLILAREKEIALRMQTYSHTTAIIDDLLDGGLAATIFVCGQVNARRAEGKVRALAVTSKDRLQNWPAVKTFTEQGVPMDINGWVGWFVPANTPDPTISDLFNEVTRMQQTQDYQELQKRYLLTQVSLSPEQIKQRITEENGYYGKLITELGISKLSNSA